jgi:hypothetical protein
LPEIGLGGFLLQSGDLLFFSCDIKDAPAPLKLATLNPQVYPLVPASYKNPNQKVCPEGLAQILPVVLSNYHRPPGVPGVLAPVL